MKLAFVSTIFAYPWGGADTLWTCAAEAASARGDRLLLAVSAAVATDPRVAVLAAAGARIAVRTLPKPPRSLWARLGRKVRSLGGSGDPLAAELGRFAPDLVVISCGGTYDLVAEPALAAWLRKSGTPYRLIANWQTEHPSLSEADLPVAAGGLERAETVFFVSERNLEVTRRHLRRPLPRARVIHNPLRWRPEDVSPWPPGPPWVLVTAGRLEAMKGVSVLLEAAVSVLGGRSDWRLDLFGRGAEEPRLREEAGRLGLSERVRFRGFVPNLRTLWEEGHLLVSPAKDEGVPLTLPEALLCERPALATEIGGTNEWLRRGISGFVCPANPTPAQLAAVLREAWERREDWRSMGLAAAAAARAFYRPDDYLRLIEAP